MEKKRNNRNGSGKPAKTLRATKSRSPHLNTGASSIRPKGDSFVYIETSGCD